MNNPYVLAAATALAFAFVVVVIGGGFKSVSPSTSIAAIQKN